MIFDGEFLIAYILVSLLCERFKILIYFYQSEQFLQIDNAIVSYFGC